MNIRYYCFNCDVTYDEDQVDRDNGTAYCVWCDSEDLLLVGSNDTPHEPDNYVMDCYSPITDNHWTQCNCEDYPCCGH